MLHSQSRGSRQQKLPAALCLRISILNQRNFIPMIGGKTLEGLGNSGELDCIVNLLKQNVKEGQNRKNPP